MGCMSSRPAALFKLMDGQGSLGRIARGARADLVVFDPHEEWRVDVAAFASRGHNTPLDGATLRGRVAMTLAAGRVVYDRQAAKAGATTQDEVAPRWVEGTRWL
jgi:dihydroorotase-like cyclic amidohydrolase